MSVSTAVSRITGFVRTWAMAVAMGATITSSSYVVANNIPNMVYELVAGGLLSSMFIPLFIECLQKDGEEGAWRFASSLLNLSAIVLGLVALVGTIWAEPFVRTQTFAVSPEKVMIATYFFRFFAVQIVFYGVAAIITGILNSHRRFLAPAVAPIFNNIVVVVTLLGFYLPLKDSRPELATMGLAIGTTLGVVAMMLVEIPSLVRIGIKYQPILDLKSEAVRKMGRQAVPILLYVATNMVHLSFRNAFAFAATDKGPAALFYAWMWYQLPYGVFAVALATAVFPEMAEDAQKKDWACFKADFAKGITATGLLILPLAAMLIALAQPLVRLYRAGDFAASDIPLVAGVLSIWAAGLFSYAAYMFTVKAFYSMQDPKTPMTTNIFMTTLQVGLYATLTTGILGWKGVGLQGIPAGDAVAYTLHTIVLTLILRRRVGGFGAGKVLWSLLRVSVAAVAGGAAAIGVLAATASLSDTRLGFLLQILVGGAAGLSVSYLMAWLMRIREIAVAMDMLRRFLARLRPGADEA